MNYIIIDIGGTNTRVALFQKKQKAQIIKFGTKDNFSEEVEAIIYAIKSYRAKIEGISISAPGPADYDQGIFGSLPNLPRWKNKNILQTLKDQLQVNNIIIQNDANLMALANHYYFKNEGGITQFFTISTGLGAGLIVNNCIFKGFNGFAQEVANAPLAFSSDHGKDLSEGALEFFASGSGIATRTKLETKKAFSLYSTNSDITKIINEGIDTLANAIATSIAFINPNLIVFDGTVARNNKWYVEKAWKIAQTRCFAEALKSVQMKIAEINDDSALLGAYYNIQNYQK